MENKTLEELFCRTSAPFAIDRTGFSFSSREAPYHLHRPVGLGSIEYVLSGKGIITENDVTFQVKAGDVFILHAGAYHDYYSDPDDPWTKIWVQMSGPAVSEILRAYGLQNVNHIPDFDLKEELLRIHHLIHPDTDQETIDREGVRLFLELVQKIHGELQRRRHPHDPSPAEAIRHKIDSTPDGYITLDQLTEEFHFSKQYLIRVFKDYYGITPHEYILIRRTDIARSLLRNTNLSIKEIADQLQFCDVSYFSDFIRRRTGQSPAELRKNSKIANLAPGYKCVVADFQKTC